VRWEHVTPTIQHLLLLRTTYLPLNPGNRGEQPKPHVLAVREPSYGSFSWNSWSLDKEFLGAVDRREPSVVALLVERIAPAPAASSAA